MHKKFFLKQFSIRKYCPIAMLAKCKFLFFETTIKKTISLAQIKNICQIMMRIMFSDLVQESDIKNKSNSNLETTEVHKKRHFSCQQRNAFFNFSFC